MERIDILGYNEFIDILKTGLTSNNKEVIDDINNIISNISNMGWAYYWLSVIQYYNVSESFIEYFSDYLDWERLCRYCPLSEDLVVKYKDKIPADGWDNLLYNNKVSIRLMPKVQEIYARRAEIPKWMAKFKLSMHYYNLYLKYKACKDLIE